MTDEIQILVADDHPVFRQGLAMMIATDKKLKVVAEAGNGKQSLELIQELQPDIAVLDVNMPEMTGFEVARQLQEFNLATGIIFLTMHNDEGMFNTALDLGVKGYLLKESAVKDIVAGIKAVAKGENFISPTLSTLLMKRLNRAEKSDKSPLDLLTASERKVLKLVSKSKSNKQIADELFISIRTVENHRSNICAKLGLEGKNALLTYALTNRSEI